MAKIALTGGAYQARSVVASAQRCLNLFPESMPQEAGEPMPVAHYPTPGLRLLKSLSDLPIRGVRQASNGKIFAVGGSTVFLIDPVTWAGTAIGNITVGLTTPVSMSDNGLVLVIVDGSANGWTVNLTSNAFALIQETSTQTPVTAAATAVIGADNAVYTAFTALADGEVSTVTVTLGTGFIGNLTCALFASNGLAPTDIVASAVPIANPVAGVNTFIFSTDPATGAERVVANGTQYWLGFVSDTSAGTWSVAAGTTGATSPTPYASFPVASPPVSAFAAVVCSATITTGPFFGADAVDYLDTFFVFNKPGTPQFYWSLSLAVAFDPLGLDFANKESFSDLLVTLRVAKREIFLFGERTTEMWANTGATDSAAGSSQFTEVQSAILDQGCAAKYSVATYDNIVFWLSRNRSGQGQVVMTALSYLGYQAKRISTFAIEHQIATYARIDDAVGFTYAMAGHAFYVLSFPSADHTWVFDVVTGLWHEWLYTDSNGDDHRHRGNCAYLCNDTIVVGDWQWSNLYSLERETFTDWNFPIRRVRAFPHLLQDGRRIFLREVEADMETGVAPKSGGVPDNLLVSLRLSTDRGHSYGSPVTQAIGGTSPTLGAGGDYRTICQWQRCGMARDFVIEFSWTVSANTVLQGAWVRADVADAEDTAPAQVPAS